MRPALLAAFLLAACVPQPDQEDLYWWRLTAIDGQPYTARALIAYPAGGKKLVGIGPCNRFSAKRVTEPFPTDRATDIVATEMACDNLAEEQRFLTALSEMERMGVSTTALYLVNDAGRRLDFVPASP
jgi:heat shock protein HslJ